MTRLPKDWTIGVGAPGLNKPLPEDIATHTHRLFVTHIWPSWYSEIICDRECPGEAKASHERLAKRWKAAGYDFERDRKTLTLTKRYEGELAHTEIVQHIAVIA